MTFGHFILMAFGVLAVLLGSKPATKIAGAMIICALLAVEAWRCQ